jgi:hypothetical protein
MQMSETSPVLSLPLIQPAQAQKHVTHNEALWVLDAVVQLAVIRADQATPPASPPTGARYIVAVGASGDWTGHDGAVAVRTDVGWDFFAPQAGWRAQVLTPEGAVVFDPVTGWNAPLAQSPQIGVNAIADSTNRLSVSAPATLLNHEGAGHLLKINKAGVTDTASLLYQTGFSGRAEMGLAGDDAFSLKVSADGSVWTEALRAAPATGVVAFPRGVALAAPVTGTGVQQNYHDTTDGRLLRAGAYGWGQGGDVQSNVLLNAALSSGVHQFGPADPDRPVATGGSVLVVRYASQWLSQIVFAANESAMWLRRSQNNGSSWSSWVPLTPQFGSNANGRFTQFADGRMICTHRVTTAAAGTLTWVFPSAFVDATSTQVQITPLGSTARLTGVASVATTNAALRTYTAAGAGVAQLVMVTATGQWM